MCPIISLVESKPVHVSAREPFVLFVLVFYYMYYFVGNLNAPLSQNNAQAFFVWVYQLNVPTCIREISDIFLEILLIQDGTAAAFYRRRTFHALIFPCAKFIPLSLPPTNRRGAPQHAAAARPPTNGTVFCTNKRTIIATSPRLQRQRCVTDYLFCAY